MFGKKRQKNINIVNPVFGELEYRNSMYHGTTQITLWHKRFDIKVFPVTNSKSTEITPKQERAYEYFKDNIHDIQKQIEKTIENDYKINDTDVLLKRLEPCELIFTLNGGVGLEIFDNDADDEYDADFVISIHPQIGIDTEDHYLSCAICDEYIDD